MGTSLDVSATIERPTGVLERLLLDEAMLEALVDKQHATTKRVEVDRKARRSNLMWTTTLDGHVPEIVSRLVGRTFYVTASMSAGTGPLSIDVRGKHDGQLRGSLELAEVSVATTRVRVRGDITVSVGIGGGTAAKLGRDQVLKPIFVDDMFPLLRDWPDPAKTP